MSFFAKHTGRHVSLGQKVNVAVASVGATGKKLLAQQATLLFPPQKPGKSCRIFGGVSAVMATCPLQMETSACLLFPMGFSLRDLKVFLKCRFF